MSTDPVTARMPGPAIRAWNLAEQLSARHEVTLASTVACDRTHPGFATRFADHTTDLPALEAWADIVVAPAGVLGFWPSLATTEKVVVFDIYDPYHLEHLEPSAPGLSAEARTAEVEVFNSAIMDHLACGDLFLCASERQRDFWIGSLMAAGRVNAWTYDAHAVLEALIVVVPFGISPAPPPPVRRPIWERIPGIHEGDDVVVWGGGIYNWLDPRTVILAVDQLRARRPSIRLVFLGAGHPNPAIPAMGAATDARALSDRLGLSSEHVFFNADWVPYDERSDLLLGARAAVSTHLDHLETRYSFRTRVLDYLWAGTPMVLTSGDSLSGLVEAAGAGVAVPAGDVGAAASALDRVLDLEVPDERFAALRSTFAWSRVAEPLVAFCDRPTKAPDRHRRRRLGQPAAGAGSADAAPAPPADAATPRAGTRQLSLPSAAALVGAAAVLGAGVARRRTVR